MKSFFDNSYQTPAWFTEKNLKTKLSRRGLLKSAAGASALSTVSTLSWSATKQNVLNDLVKSDPWLTLDATLQHLLPESTAKINNSPSAVDINALAYLYQVMTVQPTEQAEKQFILKGVGWLNGFANSEYNKAFVALSRPEKEILLRSISRTQAGGNWLNTLLNYIFEAMLAPPAYGGNPQGVGWQWLEHQAGFPLPKAGQRYFELPPRSKVGNKIAIRHIDDGKTNIKKSSKA